MDKGLHIDQVDPFLMLREKIARFALLFNLGRSGAKHVENSNVDRSGTGHNVSVLARTTVGDVRGK